MPAALRSVNCFHDSECNPDRINVTFLAVENIDNCEHRALLRHVNESYRARDSTGTVTAAGREGRMVAKFDGWLKDKALQHPYAVQYHKHLGLLVSTGGKVMRYDPHSGDFLQTLVDIGQGAGEEGQKGEVTCFHVE